MAAPLTREGVTHLIKQLKKEQKQLENTIPYREAMALSQKLQSGAWRTVENGNRKKVATIGGGLSGLSCAKYRSEDWLRANRPEWPPQLVANAVKYASDVPQGPIVVPAKGAGLDRAQCSVLLSQPGVGDAVPCFK